MLTNCTHCITPAILPTDATTLCRTAEQLTFTPRLQLDIVDGTFATPATWPYQPAGVPTDVRSVLERFDVQVDIMAVDPYAAATAWLAAGAAEVVIHLASVADLDPIKALCQRAQAPLWLAGGDTVDVKAFLPHLDAIAGVQLMGISTIGQQSQPLSPQAVTRVRELRAVAPMVPIQVDGSVNQSTIADLYAAGATDFIVGSAIVQAPDPRAAYHQLRDMVPVCR